MRSKDEIFERFIHSSELLRGTAESIAGDDVKMDMVSHIYPKLAKSLAWHEGVKVMMADPNYDHSVQGPALIEEMDRQADATYEIVDELLKVLMPLTQSGLA